MQVQSRQESRCRGTSGNSEHQAWEQGAADIGIVGHLGTDNSFHVALGKLSPCSPLTNSIGHEGGDICAGTRDDAGE